LLPTARRQRRSFARINVAQDGGVCVVQRVAEVDRPRPGIVLFPRSDPAGSRRGFGELSRFPKLRAARLDDFTQGGLGHSDLGRLGFEAELEVRDVEAGETLDLPLWRQRLTLRSAE